MSYIGQHPRSYEDLVDFIVTTGDNIYPVLAHDPTDYEFELILDHFRKPFISNLAVYPTRGNHDCGFDWQRELLLNETYANWTMPYIYYKKEFKIDNNKKLGILFMDTCSLMCSNYTYNAITGEFEETIYSNSCSELDRE